MNKISTSFFCLLVLVMALSIYSCYEATQSRGQMEKQIPDVVDFNFHVKPILSDRCFTCHGPDENSREGDLAFHTQEHAFAALGENLDRYAIVAGHPDSSTMVSRIYADDPDNVMPPPESNLTMTDYEREIITRWIEQGAEWKEHWSLIPPTKANIPKVTDEAWIQNEIDYFVLSKIEAQGYSPNERADKRRLLRRASFDLTGLAPSKKQIAAFLKDDSDNAFEKQIDQMLSGHAYAERMSSEWMDLARYADTHGYQDDFERFNWPWRDWVIHAFDTNMPYDQFVTWQIAGDLLPDASLEQKLATAFNRNHKITQEGGVIPEEYRVEYVADRTNTFGMAFIGLSMECARCHDHKYDPISQKNYFELYSFFNNVPEEGLIATYGAIPEPYVTLTQEDMSKTLDFINAADSIKEVPVLVMGERKDKRQTYILSRGQYDLPTQEVFSSTPESILAFTDKYDQSRLGLTQWLFDSSNPLTARVAVNRLWQQLFGSGIVKTSYDFGNQGTLPTHPALLDYLAVTYQENGWNTKEMLKYIMSSSTYQQSAKLSAELLEADPENSLLARAPRNRLQSEMIRDHALDISNLLVDKVGGPSVKPYQPGGLWEETTGGGGGSTAKYIQDDGDGLYRRSLYTFWKRTVPPPSMMTFDSATRDICSVKRQITSTPLQALVMMNDPQIVEAARMLAYRSIEEADESAEDRISFMFELATSRQPDKEEVSLIKTLFDIELDRYIKQPENAGKFLSVGNFAMKPILEVSEFAAYASVASAILNLDETITRG